MAGVSLKTIEAIEGTIGNDFTLHPWRSLAASHSGHGVVFGDYAGYEVAVKPFYGEHAHQKATYEERMTEIVRDLGFFTLETVEVVKGEDIALLLTKYETGFVGGNALSIEAKPGTRTGKRASRAVTNMVLTIADLHSARITHGDPQTKNWGFRTSGSAEQKLLIFDLEKAAGHGAECKYMGGAITRDLRSQVYSLGVRKYGGDGIDSMLEHLNDTVLEPYADRLAKDVKDKVDLIPILDNTAARFLDTRVRFDQWSAEKQHQALRS